MARITGSGWFQASSKLERPTNLVATAVSPTQIDLTWSDNSDRDVGCRVYRSFDGVTYDFLSFEEDIGGYTDIGLAPSTTYYYKVYASLGNNFSDPGFVSGTTIVAYVYPYSVYPKLAGGIFDNDTIPNTSAYWRVVSANSPERWVWYNGGGYTFDAAGATPGVYTATYEVQNWDNLGNNAQATVSVTVTA